jgi:hypothetical protein
VLAAERAVPWLFSRDWRSRMGSVAVTAERELPAEVLRAHGTAVPPAEDAPHRRSLPRIDQADGRQHELHA